MKKITRILDFCPDYDLRNISSLEEMLLFDIETTGLKKESTQLYLIGCVYYQNGHWFTIQWLTENASDEFDVLEEFLDFAQSYNVLVHFNGDGFDLPYLQYKADYYQLGIDFGKFRSFDIYKRAKKSRKMLAMKSMSQKSIEQFLGIYREDQLNGGLLIPVYYNYEKTNSKELERLLLLHNYDDLQGMLKILPILCYTDALEGKLKLLKREECQNTAIFEYEMETSVPVMFEAHFQAECQENEITVCMEKNMLQISVPILDTIGRIPLDNVSDYYYLPEQDMVIHKDLAQFMEKSRRVKATKKNCCLKKQSRFILQPKSCFAPEFYLEGYKKSTFADYNALIQDADSVKLTNYGYDLLHMISGC